MLRKLALVVAIIAAVGLGVFWFITIPATVPASALGPHTPNAGERQDHVLRRRLRVLPRDARPGRQDQLGGGRPLKSPFGTFYAPNISQRSPRTASATGARRISSPRW